MMVVFEKGEPIRCIGHLDLMRTMQRALRRSHLPIRYSNGFNPHIRLSFAAPLSVGIIGLRELMEVPVEGDITEKAFMDGLNAVLPDCMRVKRCRALADSFPTLMSLVGGSLYTLRFAVSDSSAQAVQALDGFMALKEYVANRKTKSGENPCDIRPYVKGASVTEKDGEYLIRLETLFHPSGALKPTLWLDSLCDYADAPAFAYLVYREAILSRAPSGQLVPMEDLP